MRSLLICFILIFLCYVYHTSAFCGNGILEATEQCDDGNKENGDGCSNICRQEPGSLCPIPPTVTSPTPDFLFPGDSYTSVHSPSSCSGGLRDQDAISFNPFYPDATICEGLPDFNNNGFLISAWIKPADDLDYDTFYTIFAKWIKPTSPHLRFGILGNTLQLQMGVQPSGQIRAVTGYPIYFPPNIWTHVAVGYDWIESEGFMYVNGLQKFVTTDHFSSPRIDDELVAHLETTTRIGHVLDANTNLPGDFFYGNISMVTVYQTYKRPEEVYELYLEQLLKFNGNYTRKCQGTCGNGILETSEACDDANNKPGDGCYNCQVENGYNCPKYQPLTYSKSPVFSYMGDSLNPQYPTGNCQTFGQVQINGEEIFLNGRARLECDPFLIDGNITLSLWIKGPPAHGDGREIYTWEEFKQTVVQVWSGNPNTSFVFNLYAGTPTFSMNRTDSSDGELSSVNDVSNFLWQSDPDSIWTFLAVTIDDTNKRYLSYDDVIYSTSYSTYSSTETVLEQTSTNYRLIVGAKNNGTDLIQPYLGSVAGITVWDSVLSASELRDVYISQLSKFKAPRNGIACASSCGNGILEDGEQCDDNNNDNDDGCSGTCTSETGKSCSISPLSTYRLSPDWEFPNNLSTCSQVGNSLLRKGEEFVFPFITNTYFNCSPNFNPTTQLTVASWVKFSQKVSDYARDWVPIVARWGSNYDEIQYNQFTFNVYSGDIYDLEINNTYIASTYFRNYQFETWQLYVATYTEDKEMKIYINGQLLFTRIPDDIINPLPNRPILVGAHVPSSGIIDPSQIFSGSISKIWMWNRTLNQSEVHDLFISTVQKYWTSDNVCQFKCGNGIMEDGETCDDGNIISGDGCSSTCLAEAGFTCTELQLGNWDVPLAVFPYDPNYPQYPISACLGEPRIGLFPSQVVDFKALTDQRYVCNFEFNLTSEFTFSAWVKIDSSSVNGTIFSRWRDYGTDSYYWGYEYAKILKIALDRGKPFISADDLTLKANKTMELNKWNSLIISLKTNGGDLKMYLNGIPVISPTKYFKPLLVQLNEEYVPYMIGSHYEDYPDMNATAFYRGSLSDLKIWNYAMNDSEIIQLYNISSSKYGECLDIDECATNNGGCQVKCVNTIGSFNCLCPPGYEIVANASTNCTDINECLDNNGGCIDICFNTLGSYVCSCSDINAKLNFDGKSCSCKTGFELNGNKCYDIDECKLGTHICNYTCINTQGGYTCGCPTGFQTVNLYYCEDVDECIYKQDSPDCENCTNTVGSFFCSCNPGNILFEEICQDALAIENRGKLTVGGIAGIVIGSIIGIIILILIILAILFGRRYLFGNYLSLLPPDVRAPYEHFFSNTSEWTKKGEPAFYCRSIAKGSKEWSSVEAFLGEMDGEDLVPSEIFAIFNPTLTSNFANQRALMASRFSANPNLFLAKGWERNDPNGLRAWAYEKYRDLTRKFTWNDGQAAPIIASVHGTAGDIAWKICETGFVALSSLDAGYYGKGIYFTSSCMYAVPYYATRPNPTILISYLTAGNIYPVTEHYKSESSLMGSALVPGYNSHYVLTNKDGSVCNEQKDKYFDEIVIDQESQVCPLYLIHLEPDNMMKLSKKFQRDVPDAPTITPEVQRNMDIEMRIL